MNGVSSIAFDFCNNLDWSQDDHSMLLSHTASRIPVRTCPKPCVLYRHELHTCDAQTKTSRTPGSCSRWCETASVVSLCVVGPHIYGTCLYLTGVLRHRYSRLVSTPFFHAISIAAHVFMHKVTADAVHVRVRKSSFSTGVVNTSKGNSVSANPT